MNNELNQRNKIRSKITSSPVNEIHFTKIKNKLLKKRASLKWSKQNVDEALELYQMFLFLCWKYPSKKIVPTFEINVVWHEHILQTKKYILDCEKVFGQYLHHNSNDFGIRYLDKNFLETLALVEKEFN